MPGMEKMNNELKTFLHPNERNLLKIDSDIIKNSLEELARKRKAKTNVRKFSTDINEHGEYFKQIGKKVVFRDLNGVEVKRDRTRMDEKE